VRVRVRAGGYAVVYKGVWHGQAVAIKELKPAAVSPFEGDDEDRDSQRKAFEEFRHEVWIMRCASYPCPPHTGTHDATRTRTTAHTRV
jgi:hypothetical protein